MSGPGERELNDLLGGLLNKPGSMEKLGDLLSALSGGGGESEPAPPPPASPPDLSGLMGLLGGDGGQEVALLRALRPYLHDGREKRVDEAIDMLRLWRLLPLLTKKP